MQTQQSIKFLLSFLLLSCFTVNALAKDPTTDITELLEMSIDELLDVQVSVASLKKEHILESPAIVSTFTRVDLESMGLRNLSDLLSFFPGFVVTEQLAGSAAVQIRGLSDTRNQKILFLLDETPYWFASNGNIPLLGIPFSLIEKVEVIRGPGSVIYGTNATAGVIKIVTRKNNENDVSFEAGKNDTINLHGYIGAEQYHLAYQFSDSDGYNSKVKNSIADAVGNTENGYLLKYDKTKSAYVSLRKDNISGFLSAFESEESGGYFGSIRPYARYIDRSVIANTTYSKRLNEQDLDVSLDFNHYTREQPTQDMFVLFGISGDGSSEFADDNDNYRWRVNAQLTRKISNQHTLIYGIESERRSTSASLVKDDVNGANLALLPPGFVVDPRYNALVIYEDDDVSERSAYVQSDVKSTNIRFVAGLRYTDNTRSGYSYIPRLAAVYQFNNSHSIKALYSVGFNSPTFRQQSQVGAFGTTRNESLEAEIVRSYDLAYLYFGQQDLFVANLFYIQARDIIENVNGVFENSGDFDRAGYELDYQRIIKNNYKLFGNLSYLHQGNEIKPKDQSAVFASKYTLSIGYSKLINQIHRIGMSMQYLGERKNVDAYSLLNFNYSFEKENHQFYLTIDNVLGEKIEHPDLRTIGTSDITVQARDKQTAFIGYRYLF